MKHEILHRTITKTQNRPFVTYSLFHAQLLEPLLKLAFSSQKLHIIFMSWQLETAAGGAAISEVRTTLRTAGLVREGESGARDAKKRAVYTRGRYLFMSQGEMN